MLLHPIKFLGYEHIDVAMYEDMIFYLYTLSN